MENNKKTDIIYFVKKADTISSIANYFCVDEKMLRVDNNLSVSEEVEEGDILWIKKRNEKIHIVKPCETISSIAKLYGVSENHLIDLNGVEKVFIGQKIFI